MDPVLGSRSTDTLAGVGPPVVASGQVLPVGSPGDAPRPHDTPRPRRTGPLRVTPGPRADWFDGDVVTALCRTTYTVSADSNRIGLRLDGSPLTRVRTDELPSEGMVLGAVQVPPSGRRWYSWPTTRPPVATPSSPSWTPTTCGSARSCVPATP